MTDWNFNKIITMTFFVTVTRDRSTSTKQFPASIHKKQSRTMDFSSFNTKYPLSKYQGKIMREKQSCNEACIIKKGFILFRKNYFSTIRPGSTSLCDLTPVGFYVT